MLYRKHIKAQRNSRPKTILLTASFGPHFVVRDQLCATCSYVWFACNQGWSSLKCCALIRVRIVSLVYGVSMPSQLGTMCLLGGAVTIYRMRLRCPFLANPHFLRAPRKCTMGDVVFTCILYLYFKLFGATGIRIFCRGSQAIVGAGYPQSFELYDATQLEMWS